MINRRTRAAGTSKTSANAFSDAMKTGNTAMGIAFDDRYFASPKRKDCKLDTNNLPSSEKSTHPLASHATVVTNGKRAPKNASASNKYKKPAHPITDFFHLNAHHKSEQMPIENDGMKSVPFCMNLTCDFPALPQSPMMKKSQKFENDGASELNDHNAETIEFMSPKQTMVNGSGVKQTTPHRIVALSSPTKKLRLYEMNNPVGVFEHLKIGEGTSAKSKNAMGAKGSTKRDQQRSRRKLIVHEPENVASEPNVDTAATTGHDIVPLRNIATGVTTAAAIDAKKPILNSTIDPTAQQNTTNNKKLMAAPIVPPNRAPRATQLTDFFPIRRSVRKTKKTVEQEQMRHIEMAIEKQLEDGLVVEMFPEKGRGIVAGRPFARGEFVVEYIGELIDQTEADRREESYAKNVDFGCYMYYFKHREQQWCIDATRDTGRLGRLVNHSRNGNLMTKIVSYQGLPHLVLLAKEDLKVGEELTYDYGDRRREALIHHPWLAF